MKTLKRNNRALIEDAALHLFSQQGFHNTTTKQIAHEAGLAEGTIYNYYESKDSILINAIDSVLTTLSEQCEEILASDEPAVTKIRNIIGSWFDRYLEKIDLGIVALSKGFNELSQTDSNIESLFRRD